LEGAALKPKSEKRLLLLRHARHALSNHNCFSAAPILLLRLDAWKRLRLRPCLCLSAGTLFLQSPKRCVETIKPIPGYQVELDPNLREIDFGN
jgi:hypothetical protein